MHQNTFGGRAPPGLVRGSLCTLPDLLARIGLGLLLMGWREGGWLGPDLLQDDCPST